MFDTLNEYRCHYCHYGSHCFVQLLEDTQLTDDEAAEDVGKSMHEAKQRVKEKLHANQGDVASDAAAAAAAADTLADTALSGLEDDTQAATPATARSMG